ncbi:MAG: MYG1 family protein [Oscillospiraceae bacterium]|nr:MYG1 family protein [Oscillospiraceae bacterium]
MLALENTTSIFVHAGIFHADDAFAAALVIAAAGRVIPVERCLSVPKGLPDSIIIADIGRGKYDHHQDDAKLRADGKKYAACGLLYEELKERLFLTEEAREEFRSHFILPIEDADNGISNNPLTCYIDDMNPDWDRPEESDRRFSGAVKLFLNLIEAAQRKEKAALRADHLLSDALAKAEGKVVLLEKPVPWQRRVCQTDNLFVIYYSQRGVWTVQCVPEEPDSFIVRYPLSPMEEMEGCIFCHAGRFLAAFDSEEHAINAARKLVRESELKTNGNS